MDERRVLAVEIGERSCHLTEDERFEIEGELHLAVILQVRAKTGVHLLHDQNWLARAALKVHSKELDNPWMTQLRPHQALRFEVADQFRYSSGRLVFEQNVVETLGCAYGPVPFCLTYSCVGSFAQPHVGEHEVRDEQSVERRACPFCHFDPKYVTSLVR